MAALIAAYVLVVVGLPVGIAALIRRLNGGWHRSKAAGVFDLMERKNPGLRDGVLEIVSGGRIYPKMKLDAFEASFPGAELFDVTGVYESYVLVPIVIGGLAFHAIVTFRGDTLWLVRFVQERLSAAGWSGMTDAVMDEVKRDNDHWLRQLLGSVSGKFRWGEVSSGIDSKTGVPEIVIVYR
jgi:hypothetical protein